MTGEHIAALERARASALNAQEILLSIPGHRWMVTVRCHLEIVDRLLSEAVDEESKL